MKPQRMNVSSSRMSDLQARRGHSCAEPAVDLIEGRRDTGESHLLWTAEISEVPLEFETAIVEHCRCRGRERWAL